LLKINHHGILKNDGRAFKWRRSFVSPPYRQLKDNNIYQEMINKLS